MTNFLILTKFYFQAALVKNCTILFSQKPYKSLTLKSILRRTSTRVFAVRIQQVIIRICRRSISPFVIVAHNILTISRIVIRMIIIIFECTLPHGLRLDINKQHRIACRIHDEKHEKSTLTYTETHQLLLFHIISRCL